jgi:hypothetical protein
MAGIVTSENIDLAQMAHDVRWALLVTDAAIPLAPSASTAQDDLGFAVEPPAQDRATAPLATQHADRAALRAIAFKGVLRELMAYDYEISDEGEQALLEGSMPAEPQEG